MATPGSEAKSLMGYSLPSNEDVQTNIQTNSHNKRGICKFIYLSYVFNFTSSYISTELCNAYIMSSNVSFQNFQFLEYKIRSTVFNEQQGVHLSTQGNQMTNSFVYTYQSSTDIHNFARKQKLLSEISVKSKMILSLMLPKTKTLINLSF